MKAVVVINPSAGWRMREEKIGWTGEALRRCGIACDVVLTRKAGDGATVAQQAVEAGCDLVVACGGDGTVNEVVNGLVGSDVTLGILPMGTVNVLARSLRIPLNLGRAVENIATGVVRRIDLGRAGARCFVLMAGFGFDAEVVAKVVQPMKDIIGASAYVLKGLETLTSYRATHLTLEMPDATYSAQAFVVIVANVSTYAYYLQIAPYAEPDDGLLDICVFERPVTDKVGFMRQMAEIFFGRHIYHRAVSYFRAPSVKVRSEPDVMLQLDGDAAGKTPTEISVLPRILPVIVPRESLP